MQRQLSWNVKSLKSSIWQYTHVAIFTIWATLAKGASGATDSWDGRQGLQRSSGMQPILQSLGPLGYNNNSGNDA